MSANNASDFTEITISNKEGKEVGLVGGCVEFNYYESLLSPMVTADLTFVDTGYTIRANSKYDNQERVTNAYSGLPIVGGERVTFKITSKLGTLDFTKYPLYINQAAQLPPESNRISVFLNLFSETAKKNQEIKLYRNFSGNISNTAKNILKNFLSVPESRINVSPSINSDQFFTNYTKEPFEVLLWLAPKTIPVKGYPGYFFYETYEGFNFKSIDDLLQQDPYPREYFRTDFLKANLDNDLNDCKIQSSPMSKNQNVLDFIKGGTYGSNFCSFNSKSDSKYFNQSFNLASELEINLGKNELEFSPEGEPPINWTYENFGTYSSKVDGNNNNTPSTWHSKSLARYNSIFTQAYTFTIPCNPNLKAGDIITCNFEDVGRRKEMGSSNSVQSGKYIILHLRHYFSKCVSHTALTVIRDTYGLYT